MNEYGSVTISGWVHLRLFNEEGVLKEERELKNVVTTIGKRHIADQLAATSDETKMSYLAVGTGTTAATVSDTTLETELARVAVTSATQLAGADANKVQYVATLGVGVGVGTLTESGIFNDATAGSMLCHQVYNPVDKGENDVLEITWTLTIG